MKKLDLEFFEEDNKCTVHLGHVQWLEFKNKTKAKKFIRRYRRVLLDNVNLLNVLQPQLNLLYRQNILQLDHSTKHGISYALTTFDERFEYIFKVFDTGNKNAFVFGSIETCFNELEVISSLLYDFAKRHKNYTLKAAVAPLMKNIDLLYDQYSKDKKSLKISDSYLEPKKVKTLKTKIS